MAEVGSTKLSESGCTGSGCVAMLFFGIIGFIVLAEIPDIVVAKYRRQRNEVGAKVEAIRNAELAYQKKHGSFIPVKAYPPLSKGKAQKWEAKASGGFQTLGWMPKDGKVRGSFSVTTTADDFQVTGVGFWLSGF